MSAKRNLKLLSWLKFLGVALPAAAGIVYLVWFSPVFVIQKIIVKGVELRDEEVDNLLGKGVVGSNMLFWRPDPARPALPRFSTIDIRKNYFSRAIEIDAKERNKSLIWCFEIDESCYWVDETGYIFSPAPLSSGGLITAVFDRRAPALEIGTHVLSDEMYSTMRGILAILDRTNLPVDSIRIENIKLREVVVRVSGGPRIVFSLAIDPDFTEAAINSLLKSGSWKNIKNLNLTVYGRAYPSF